MMLGRVVDERARLQVIFRLANTLEVGVEFTIDTGFEGALTLSPSAIAKFGLPKRQQIVAKLADGSQTAVDVHEAIVLWHGIPLAVAVLAMDSDPLLGTSLLSNNLLFVDWVEGGEVRIQQHP